MQRRDVTICSWTSCRGNCTLLARASELSFQLCLNSVALVPGHVPTVRTETDVNGILGLYFAE